MTEEWRTAAGRAARNRRGAWSGTFVAATLAGLCVWLAAISDGPVRIGALAAAGLLGALGVAYGTVVYMRRIDEQERMANLWGCYAGMCVYLTLFLLDHVAGLFGIAIPHSDPAIFAATMATVLGVFAWLRFR